MLLNCGAEEDSWESLGLQGDHWKDECWRWSSNTWVPDAKSWLIRKDPDAGKDWGQEEKGAIEDEMVGWHHWCNGHEFEQVPGDSEGQGSLACCSPWGCKEWDIGSVRFSLSVMSNSLRPHESQHARPPCPSPTPGVYPDSRLSSQWCHPAISSSVILFSSCPQSLPTSESFPIVNSSHEVAKVLEFQLSHHSFQRNPRADILQNGLIGSPFGPRDSQESSPTPQFKSINSSVLSFLHSPTLTSIHDHRKNHSLD